MDLASSFDAFLNFEFSNFWISNRNTDSLLFPIESHTLVTWWCIMLGMITQAVMQWQLSPILGSGYKVLIWVFFFLIDTVIAAGCNRSVSSHQTFKGRQNRGDFSHQLECPADIHLPVNWCIGFHLGEPYQITKSRIWLVSKFATELCSTNLGTQTIQNSPETVQNGSKCSEWFKLVENDIFRFLLCMESGETIRKIGQ